MGYIGGRDIRREGQSKASVLFPPYGRNAHVRGTDDGHTFTAAVREFKDGFLEVGGHGEAGNGNWSCHGRTLPQRPGDVNG